jgi:hypothetical protein
VSMPAVSVASSDSDPATGGAAASGAEARLVGPRVVGRHRLQAAEGVDTEASDPTPLPFPTPAYDPDTDRFELTAKGEAYLTGAAEPPLA